MTLKFGTDGVRARAYTELTLADVERLSAVAARVLGGEAMLIGTDTRESGPDFVEAVCRGLSRAGTTPWVMGDAPTPAVARAAAVLDVPAAMISASHNPFHDNGVKFFAAGGRKLTDDQQATIEAGLADLPLLDGTVEPAPGVDRSDLVADYADWVVSTLGGRTLEGVRLVVDCANGAASGVAPGVLSALGAEVVTIHASPDGRNINDQAGSTHMERLADHVSSGSADLGLAFDGDADRLLAVDADGQLVDGDQIIAICALDMHDRGLLADETVVVTVMTNLGFHQGMERRGITVHQTPVGDRHVLEALGASGWSLGGEQSGHVIFHDLATTGDGLLTAVQLLDVVARRGLPLATLADESMRRLPQRLRNVQVDGSAPDVMAAISDDIARVDAQLGATGRLLVRPSGTEPLIRVMAEAPSQAEADAAVDDLVAVLEAR